MCLSSLADKSIFSASVSPFLKKPWYRLHHSCIRKCFTVMENTNDPQIITTAECIEVLRNALKRPISEIDVVSFRLDPVEKEVVGLLGEYFNLVIFAKIGNNLELKKFEYFIKTVPLQDAHSSFIEKVNVFPKETALYSIVFKEIDKYGSCKWHAECHYVRSDLIVMENLRKLHYRHIAEDEFFSIDHFKLALRRLAGMHASSIIFEEKTGINIGTKYAHILQEEAVTQDSEWLHVGLETIKQLAKTLPKFQNDAAQRFISEEFMKCKNKIVEVVQPSKEFKNVLCHRDMWVKNLLFKYDEKDATLPIDCMLVDFQITSYSLPALDVLHLIYVNTAREFRDTHMSELLRFYYDCLCKELKPALINADDHMTWNEFLMSCKHAKALALPFSAVYTQFGNLPDGFLIDFMRKDAEGFVHCLTVERYEFVRNIMNENKGYENRMIECVEEIIDYAMDDSGLLA